MILNILSVILGLLLYEFVIRPFVLLFQAAKQARESTREEEAVSLDCAMGSKLRELLDDPTMTDAKWRQWLPIFEAADAEVRSKCSRLSLGQNAGFIRDEINDDPERTSP